jgi:hypothetical protein
MILNLISKPEVIYDLDSKSFSRLRLKDFLISFGIFVKFLHRENFIESLRKFNKNFSCNFFEIFMDLEVDDFF